MKVILNYICQGQICIKWNKIWIRWRCEKRQFTKISSTASNYCKLDKSLLSSVIPNQCLSHSTKEVVRPKVTELFENLLLKRLQPILKTKNLIPDHQFGFRQKHSTIDRVCRIIDVTERALDEKQICPAQAFDKVCQEGLI